MVLMVVLFQEIRQDLAARFPHFLVQEEAVPSQDLAAPDEEHQHTDTAVIHGQAHHIPVTAFRGGLLFFGQFFQVQQGIPVPCRRFKLHAV